MPKTKLDSAEDVIFVLPPPLRLWDRRSFCIRLTPLRKMFNATIFFVCKVAHRNLRRKTDSLYTTKVLFCRLR